MLMVYVCCHVLDVLYSRIIIECVECTERANSKSLIQGREKSDKTIYTPLEVNRISNKCDCFEESESVSITVI